jgi:hypothetical protein
MQFAQWRRAVGKHENGYARLARDFYPSPAWVTEALAEHVNLTGLRVWECACGDGRMAEALKAAGAIVHATDIVDRGYSEFAGELDFISTAAPSFVFDAVVTNPAYGERNKLAEKFVEIGLQRIADGGLLALLLPNDFDSAKTRARFFADCRAFAGKVVLTRRVVWFEPARAAPKENHSWFLWRRTSLALPPRIFYAPQRNGAAS